MQFVLAMLAIWKLHEVVSATPSYSDSFISIPPAVAGSYYDHDSQFSPYPFSSTTFKPRIAAAEPPAY